MKLRLWKGRVGLSNGKPLCKYAIAALDIIGVEKYKGQDDEVLEFIKYLLEVLAD